MKVILEKDRSGYTVYTELEVEVELEESKQTRS